MPTITMQDALNQLKIMRDRIATATTEPFVTTHNSKGLTPLGMSAEVFAARSIAALQSAQALIQNYRTLKRAINLSNAQTQITVGGVEMTVAEAIDYKRTIEYAEALRNKLTMDLTAARRIVAQGQERAQQQAETAAQTTFGNKDSASSKEYEDFVNKYVARHSPQVVDVVGAQGVIDQMTAQIDAFRAEIDLALTVSNVTTRIDVNLA